MQCEGFKPGCKNEAGYTIQGYRLCLDCFRSFANYSPGEEQKLFGGLTIAELRGLETKVRPGRWEERITGGDWWVGVVVDRFNTDNAEYVCSSVCNTEHGPWLRQEDIDLVIAARNALPGLLAEIERLRAKKGGEDEDSNSNIA